MFLSIYLAGRVWLRFCLRVSLAWTADACLTRSMLREKDGLTASELGLALGPRPTQPLRTCSIFSSRIALVTRPALPNSLPFTLHLAADVFHLSPCASCSSPVACVAFITKIRLHLPFHRSSSPPFSYILHVSSFTVLSVPSPLRHPALARL